MALGWQVGPFDSLHELVVHILCLLVNLALLSLMLISFLEGESRNFNISWICKYQITTQQYVSLVKASH